jgi:hypothetical protein
VPLSHPQRATLSVLPKIPRLKIRKQPHPIG